jgi:hypothetical protein
MHFMGLLSHRNRLVIFIIEFCSKKKTMRHLPKFILIIALASATPLYAQDSASIYKPVIDGTVRAKYEYQPQISAGRFEVRNARFSVGGKLAKQVAYKAEIDLSEEGSIKMLDAYISYAPTKPLDFTIGQMRVPFTIDAHRSPHQQYFANRSFIAKQVGNVRDVGATLRYAFQGKIPCILEAGLFNGSGLTNQKDYWAKTLNYSAKVQFALTSHLNLVLSSQSIKPDSIGIHMQDIGINYRRNNLFAEAEFLYKTYAHGAYKSVKAFDGFACYDIPLKKVLRKISLLTRYDMMTDHSDGVLYNGKLKTTDYARQRLTGGVTLSLLAPFTADIRLNYEKYFYHSGDIPKTSERDKFVAEFMVRF